MGRGAGCPGSSRQISTKNRIYNRVLADILYKAAKPKRNPNIILYTKSRDLTRHLETQGQQPDPCTRRVKLTSIGLPFTTVSKPVELPLGPTRLGSLDFVPRQLLLLELELCAVVLGFRCGGRVGDGRRSTRHGRSGPRSGCTESGSRSRLDIIKGVFDNGDLALVGQSTGIDVPDFGAERIDEFHVMRDDADGTGPFSDSDGKTTEGFSVQEIGRFVKLRGISTNS